MLRPLTYLCVLLALTGVKGQSNTSEICSVIGPALIDFQGKDGSVYDLCAYSLLSSNGFEVVASFRERYDPNVGFLDSLTLRLIDAGVEIQLQQGGGVLVNDTPANITSSVQTFFGVDLSDDATGVTAVFSSVSVFFDGDTAQISMDAAAAGSSLTGLCVDSSSISTMRLQKYSSTSCDPQNTPARRKRSNPDKAAIEGCKSIGSSSQHDHFDHSPYVKACNKLTGFVEFNHFWCQFTWAYGRACHQKHPGLFGDWRKQIKCTCLRPVCGCNQCNYNEYCDWRFDGEPGCLCRGRFAAKYRNTPNSLGEEVVCKHNTATVTLVGCLLEEKGIDYNSLHLNDQSCTGHRNPWTHLVTFDFSTRNTCGAECSSAGNQIKYNNTIKNKDITSAITRQDHVNIEFSCYYPDPTRETVHFRIKDNSYVSVISGVWNYTVHMTAYIDENCTKVVATDTEVKLNQKVWVELKTHGLDRKTVVPVTESCWATSNPDPNSLPRLDLITNGCAAEQTVSVNNNGVASRSYFSFNMFEFTTHPDDVYLHCQLHLCLKKNNNCVPDCHNPIIHEIHRRSVGSKLNAGPALISMAWGK